MPLEAHDADLVMKRIKKPGGGTRLQNVKILPSGKWKFLKNPKTAKKTTRKASTKGKKLAKGNSKMFRTLGAKGAIEDFAWGFGGLVLMGANNPVALPTVRLVQGIQGHVFGRTGKGRLVYAIIDLADLVIAGQASVQTIFDSMKQLTKIAPI
ncbi:unnamed protein product [marine sediment metagenome]|uniref:Uncharacterized protein n=1 Tax=marine sediment metagenome TaxID=412755 RepID=X1Q755_9ZZZZ